MLSLQNSSQTDRYSSEPNCSILLVEDEPDMAQVVQAWLQSQRYNVDMVGTGEEALEVLKKKQYDVIILDWMLPGISGVEVCRSYRSERGDAPIMMLTNKSTSVEKQYGLDSGSDDYLTKPFNLRELSARVRALQRRPKAFKGFVYTVGALQLDSSAATLKRNGELVSLLPKEFALMSFLLRNPDQVFDAETIMNNVWPSEAQSSPHIIRTYIKTLRKKLDVPGKPSFITTIHSVGYRLESSSLV